MTDERKIKIAETFSEEFAEAELNRIFSVTEFQKFEKGIYARSTEEKWNVFLLDNYLYCSRSWTDICIYKIRFEIKTETVELKDLNVTRNRDEYKITDLDFDVKQVNRMLDSCLKDIRI